MARALLAVLAVAGALAGCGDDDATSSTSPTPAPTATATEQPAPEEQEGGAGDEEEARVPVVFTVSDDGVLPVRVAVPAFLALELIVKNRTSEPVVARLEGAEPVTANPGETARLELEGRRKGRYGVDFGGGRTAVVITGVEPGP